ncbi:hypothetical protein GCM10017557_33820 [Streptomyces aurantiacus]|uniref:Uncharacterized protein n=1 Tax=Streptomyces aurantiacus TaxID=47760 RepID=A0A7G1NYL0_9ACTN|nr:hypothetical protein GCM10017557_33820 [Streptomyces aurantiacus]
MANSATALLREAQQLGATIRETVSNAPVRYEPRSAHDPRPWVVHEPSLDQDFRLTGCECTATFPDQARTAPTDLSPALAKPFVVPAVRRPRRREALTVTVDTSRSGPPAEGDVGAADRGA